MKVRNSRNHQEGFTLIELLVVVAIIGLLVAVAVPKLFDAINKAKNAKGPADLDTISSALERSYFDNNQYPTTPVDAALKNGYVKAGTTFQNAYGNGYLYQTNQAGNYYLLADPGNYGGSTAEIVCPAAGGVGQWISHEFTINGTVQTDASVQTGPTTAQVAAGCTLQASTKGVPSGTPLTGTKVVAN